MARPRKRARVLGPYRERGGWRVIAITATGKRNPVLCATQGEADELVGDLRAELEAKDVTVNEATDLYLAHLRDGLAQEQSVKTARYRLHAMFRPPLRDEMVADVSPRDCQAAYDDLRTRQAADTHRNTLALAKAFFAWCMTRGFCAVNPMEKVTGVGERSVGKEQLRIDEARALWAVAVKLAKNGDLGALAAVTVLATATRAGECAAIVARDIDDRGRMLVIPKAKTRAGVRRLVIDKWLGDLLKATAAGGAVFPGRDRYWVNYHVKRLCKLAGVPPVGPHGLRGTHASLATTSGASSEIVSKALGHTSTRITERHYTRAEATDQARIERATKRLKGGK